MAARAAGTHCCRVVCDGDAVVSIAGAVRRDGPARAITGRGHARCPSQSGELIDETGGAAIGARTGKPATDRIGNRAGVGPDRVTEDGVPQPGCDTARGGPAVQACEEAPVGGGTVGVKRQVCHRGSARRDQRDACERGVANVLNDVVMPSGETRSCIAANRPASGAKSDNFPAPGKEKRANRLNDSPFNLAEWTGLEPATPGVTGRYSDQLNYHSLIRFAAALRQQRRPQLYVDRIRLATVACYSCHNCWP